jgi:phosphoribosylglycinamide formyltransferase-1
VVRVAVFVSGGGTNLQAIIDAKSIRSAEIALVVADNPNAFALQRAATAGIPGIALRRGKPFNTAVLPHLQSYKIDLIVLAGFLTIIDDVLIKAYPHRIMNVHPSLVPAFAGKGFYGLNVHAAALAKGVRYTGQRSTLLPVKSMTVRSFYKNLLPLPRMILRNPCSKGL